MLTRKRIIIGALSLLLMCAAFTAVVTAVVDRGMVVIRVREASGGASIDISMPACVAQAALLALPDRAFAGNEAIEKDWLTLAREVVHVLGRSPDFTLVQVESRSEQVGISVSSGSLVISVSDDGDSVYMEVPMSLASSVLSRIGRAHSAAADQAMVIPS